MSSSEAESFDPLSRAIAALQDFEDRAALFLIGSDARDHALDDLRINVSALIDMVQDGESESAEELRLRWWETTQRVIMEEEKRHRF